jgi:hypothetical protein
MVSFTMKTALVAAIAQLVSAVPMHFKRDSGLSVELTDAGAAGVGMKVTNTGSEALKLLTYATLLDNGPVNKLRVVQDGMLLSSPQSNLKPTSNSSSIHRQSNLNPSAIHPQSILNSSSIQLQY